MLCWYSINGKQELVQCILVTLPKYSLTLSWFKHNPDHCTTTPTWQRKADYETGRENKVFLWLSQKHLRTQLIWNGGDRLQKSLLPSFEYSGCDDELYANFACRAQDTTWNHCITLKENKHGNGNNIKTCTIY